MSTTNSVGPDLLRATPEAVRSASKPKKDRSRLCAFTFADGRRCRTPRAARNRHFCFYHAQKEARARAADTLGKDVDYFFSGNYLSACDLSTALGRLIPAVVRGDVKPRTAHTVAYLSQTLIQAIHLSKHEYINAFGTDGWRRSIRNSVNENYNHRFPFTPSEAEGPDEQPDQASPVVAGLQTGADQVPQPASPQPQPVETPVNCHSSAVAQAFRPEESASSSNSSLATHNSPLPQTSQLEIATLSGPAPSPHTPLPATGAEFVDQILARVQTGGSQPQQSEIPTLSGPAPAKRPSPEPLANPNTSRSNASPSNSTPASSPSHVPESRASNPSPPPVRNERPSPDPDAPTSAKTQPIPAAPSAQPVAPAPQPACPEQGRRDNPSPTRPSTAPNREAPWLDWGPTSGPPDSHLL